MTGTLTIEQAGPGVTVQDMGRAHQLAQGLSVGGAADSLALIEAAALLGLAHPGPAIEMAGVGGTFVTDVPLRFALTGAPMRADVDGARLAWNTTHHLMPGQRLTIHGATKGSYGYLTPAAGLAMPHWLGSVSTHLVAGIGVGLAPGDALPLGVDPNPDAPAQTFAPADRFSGGVVRMIAGPQTGLFSAQTLHRFVTNAFTRGAAASRQGLRLYSDAAPFVSTAHGGLASDFILPGDIQMTGEGVPFVLLCESQTVGGYPRIGSVLPQDLPVVAQAPLGAQLRFDLLTIEAADACTRPMAGILADLRRQVRPAVRDPRQIHDLLTRQLISGVSCGDELERA